MIGVLPARGKVRLPVAARPWLTFLGSFIVFEFSNHAGWVACDDGEWRDVFGNDGASADNGAVANGHAGQHNTVEADPNIASDANRACRSASGHSSILLKRQHFKLLASLCL